MINFRSLFEKIFKSFDVSNDLKLAKRLEKDGIRFLMIIKRHWFYGILNSRRVILSLIIVFINAYLLIFSEDKVYIMTSIIGIFLVLNVLYWTFIVVVYLYRFYKIHGNEPYIEDVYSSMKKTNSGDIAFTKFFNQTILLFVIIIFLTVFIIFGLISSGFTGFGFQITNIFLMFIQIWLFYGFLKAMINLEMDFKVAVPGELIFYNQTGLLGDTQTMDSTKIKSMNSNYSNLIASFFNYGNILILAEGDQKENGEMIMDYIGNPKKTLSEMQKVLDEDLKAIEKDVNILLKRFKKEIGVDDVNSKENLDKLKKFVEENEETMKAIFKNGDEETKREVKELYVLINS